MATSKKNNPGATDGAGSVLSTVSGPSNAPPPATLGSADPVASACWKRRRRPGPGRADACQPEQAGGIRRCCAHAPAGSKREPSTPAATGSTSSEIIASDKVGSGVPPQGENPTVGPLDRVRVEAADSA